jgi:hypothetical protein
LIRFIKATLAEQRAPWTGVRALAKADDTWNEVWWRIVSTLYSLSLSHTHLSLSLSLIPSLSTPSHVLKGRYDAALPLYEAALDQLRADTEPPPPDALVHCAARIELLRDRQASGGRFERPIPLGHAEGALYVDPAPPPSKWQSFKHKAAKVKKKTVYALEDLDL